MNFESQSQAVRALSSAGALLGALVVALAVGGGGCSAQKRPPAKADTSGRDAADARFAEAAKQPPNAKTMYAMARILVAQGRDRDAVNLLNRIIQQYATYLPAYNELAGVYFRSDRMNDATTVLTAAIKHAPADPVLHNNLGMCRLAQRDYERALESFRQASWAEPDNGVYQANVAVALGMLGRDGEALKQYRGLISRDSAEWNLDVLGKARKSKAPGKIEASSTDTAAPGGAL